MYKTNKQENAFNLQATLAQGQVTFWNVGGCYLCASLIAPTAQDMCLVTRRQEVMSGCMLASDWTKVRKYGALWSLLLSP